MCNLHPHPSPDLILEMWNSVRREQCPISLFHPHPGTHPSTLCLYESDCSRDLRYVKHTIFVLLWLWLIPLCIMSSRLTHVVTCVRVSFLFKSEWYAVVCLDYTLFSCVHLSLSVFCILLWPGSALPSNSPQHLLTWVPQHFEHSTSVPSSLDIWEEEIALLKGRNLLHICKYHACFPTQSYLSKLSLQEDTSVNNLLPGTVWALSYIISFSWYFEESMYFFKR